MSALPIEPTERDRERFRDITKAMRFGLEYDRHGDDYKYDLTAIMFRLWWSVERERQLLQNLNQSQGCKISELMGLAEKAEAAPAVPATCNDSLQVELIEMLRWMIGQRGKSGHNHKRPGVWDDDNGVKAGAPCETCAMYDKARALLQSSHAVPEEWREVMTELADDLAIEIDQSYPPERRAYPSEQRRYEGEMAIVNRARALLQSSDVKEFLTTQPDCRTCANRVQVNGLSQESYCDSCVYQGRGWRQNHFVDVSEMVDVEGFRASTKDAARGAK